MAKLEQKGRGLPALQQSRETRRRALVLGKVRLKEAAPQFWIWTLVIFAAFGVIYWNISQRELQSRIGGVMAKQRAVAQELGPRLLPLRDRLETHAQELAGDWKEPLLSASLDLDALSHSKGLYLRALLSNAADLASLRKAATESLHDGFTSCLFASAERARGEQRSCVSSAQCEPGELCNDAHLCSVPTQPYNARLMYRALRVLGSDWSDDLHKAADEYQVRVFENDLDKVSHDDAPIGVQLATSARYLTILLDEMPAKGELPAETPGQDPKGLNRPEVRLQLVEHPVRLGVWDLNTDQQLVRLRISAGAEFVAMGRVKSVSDEGARAQQRQVNNCSIAAELKQRAMSAREVSQVNAAPAAAAASNKVNEPAARAASMKTNAARAAKGASAK